MEIDWLVHFSDKTPTNVFLHDGIFFMVIVIVIVIVIGNIQSLVNVLDEFLSNSTATLAAQLKDFVGSSSAKSAEKLRSHPFGSHIKRMHLFCSNRFSVLFKPTRDTGASMPAPRGWRKM